MPDDSQSLDLGCCCCCYWWWWCWWCQVYRHTICYRTICSPGPGGRQRLRALSSIYCRYSMPCCNVRTVWLGRSTLWVKKLDPFSFEHNFCKYRQIIIILSPLLQTEIICPHKQIEFPTLSIVCCCTTLKNATAYTYKNCWLNLQYMR